MATIEQLYYCYDVLSQAKDDAGKGATGETSSKMLTLQFLPKFSKHFPQLLTQAFEYQLDLCEDNDVRRQSVKYLLEYAKIDEKLFLKVADILIQLRCVDDNIVRECAQKSIETLLSINPLMVATAAITHLEETGEPSVFIAVDTLQSIFIRKPPLSGGSEEDITNFKQKLNESIEKCMDNLHLKINLDNSADVSHYNKLMISFLILLNPSSTKLITPPVYVQKTMSVMSIVTDHLMNVNHLLDLVKMYKLIEPYLMANHTLVNGFVLNYVHSKLLPRLPTMKESFVLADSTESQMYRILYVIFIQEIVILLTYLPVSEASGCIPLFLNLLSGVLPTLDKFDPQNNSYTADTVIDSEVLGCYLLGFYYVMYKTQTVDTAHKDILSELRSRLSLLLRVVNSRSPKCFMGPLKCVPKIESNDPTFDNNTTSEVNPVGVVDNAGVPATSTTVKPMENSSKHPQITPPSSPTSPEKNKSRTITWNSNNRSVHNKRSAQIYAPPYKRVSKPPTTRPTESQDTMNAIKLLTKALIDEPISTNVSLLPFWKSDKFLTAVRSSIASCLANSESCRATTCSDIFKVVENAKNTLELVVAGSTANQSRSISNSVITNGGVNNFSLKRQVRNKRGTEKNLPAELNPKSQPVAKKRVAKAGRGRGRRR